MKSGKDSRLKTFIRWGRRLLLALVILYALLHTRPVQDEIANRLSKALSSEGVTIQLRGLHGIFPFWLELDSLSISDENGVWLEASHAKTKWLYQNQRIVIETLRVKHLSVARAPAQTSTKTKKTSVAEQIPLGIELQSGTFSQVQVGSDLIGQDAEFQLHVRGQADKALALIDADYSLSSHVIDASGNLQIDLSERSLSADLIGKLFKKHPLEFSLRKSSQNGSADLKLESSDAHLILTQLLKTGKPFFRNPEAVPDTFPSLGTEPQPLRMSLSGTVQDGVLSIQNDITIGNGTLAFPITWNLSTKEAKAQLRMYDLVLNQTNLDRIAIDIHTSNRKWNVQASELNLSRGPLTLQLPEPLVLVSNGSTFSFSETEFQLNGYSVMANGSWDSDRMDLVITLPDIDLDKLPKRGDLDLTGIFRGRLHLDGRWETPRLRTTIELQNIEIDYEDLGAPNRIQGRIEGVWDQQRLHVDGSLEDQIGNKIHMNVDSADTWSLKPFRIPGEAFSFDAEVLGNLDLSMVNKVVWFSEHRLFGKLQADVKISRKDREFDLSGSVTVEKGRYESFQLGTQLNDLNARIDFQKQQFTLHSLSATTPGKGVIQAEGSFSGANRASSNGQVTVKLSNAQLVHLDPVKSAVSGTITLTKEANSSPALSGKILLEETLFNLDRLPSPPPKVLPFSLEGVADVPPEQRLKTPKKSLGVSFAGGVQVEIPGKLIVEGKNIYSVWEGGITLLLKPDGIYLSGKLNPRRGTVTFFGRAFRLDSGSVFFNDAITVPPILDLEAKYSRADFDAALRISGRADNPVFSLRSSPPLPEDEIIAYILFGKNLSTITGLQALEVGLALKSMMDRSGSSNWDFMRDAKSLLGVDNLEFRESGDVDGSTEIVAGRQINDTFYIEVRQNLKEPDSSLVLEYEVRKNFSITTETGTHILPGIGVNWKRDY